MEIKTMATKSSAKVKSNIKNVIKIAIGEAKKRKRKTRRRKPKEGLSLSQPRPDRPSGGQSVFPSTVGNFLHGSSPSPLYPYQILLEQMRGRDKPRVEFLDSERRPSGTENLRLELGRNVEEIRNAQLEAEERAEERERKRYEDLLRRTGTAFGMLQQQIRSSTPQEQRFGLEEVPPLIIRPTLGLQTPSAIGGLSELSPRESEGEEFMETQEEERQPSPPRPTRQAPPPPVEEQSTGILGRLSSILGGRQQVQDQPTPQTTLQAGAGGGGATQQEMEEAMSRGRERAQRGDTDVASLFQEPLEEESSTTSSTTKQKGPKKIKGREALSIANFTEIQTRDQTKVLNNTLKLNTDGGKIQSKIGTDPATLTNRLFSKVPVEELNKIAFQFGDPIKRAYRSYLIQQGYQPEQLKDLGL